MVLITYFTPKSPGGDFFFTPPSSHKEKKKLYYIIHIVCTVCVCFNFEFIIWNYDIFPRALHFSMFDLICWFLVTHITQKTIADDDGSFRISKFSFSILRWCDDDVPPPSFVFMSVLSVSFPLLLIWFFFNGNYSTKQRL